MGPNIYSQIYFDTTFLLAEQAIHFDVDRSEIRDQDTSVLLDLLDPIKLYDSTIFIIRAHTDSDGSKNDNLKLSDRRGKAVRDFLQSKNSDMLNFQLELYGEDMPLHPDDSERHKAENRRVEVGIFAKQRMTRIYGTVLDDSTGSPLQVPIYLYSKRFVDSTRSDVHGNYELIAPIKSTAVIEVRSDLHLPHFIPIEVKPVFTSKPLEIRTYTAKIGRNFKLLNLNFFGNQSRPLPGSRKTLDVVGKYLRAHPGICVEVQGHINEPGSGDVSKDSESFFLSVARAKVVYDYLQMFHLISEDRMYYRGYGDWQMLYPHARSGWYQQLNRRVEIHICSCADSENLENSEGSSLYQFYVLEGRKNVFN